MLGLKQLSKQHACSIFNYLLEQDFATINFQRMQIPALFRRSMHDAILRTPNEELLVESSMTLKVWSSCAKSMGLWV